MKIRTKILSGFGIIAAIGVCLGLTGLYGGQKLTSATGNIRELSKSGSSLSTILYSHYLWRQGLSDAVFRGLPFKGSLDPTACALGRWLEGEDSKLITDPRKLAFLRSVIEPHIHIHNHAHIVLDHLSKGENNVAQKYFEENILPQTEFVIAGLEGMNDRNEAMLGELTQATYSFGRKLEVVKIAMIIIAIAMSMVLALLISRAIVHPITSEMQTLEDIAKGDLTKSIHIESKDEIGDFFRIFNMTMEKIKSMIMNIRGEASKLSGIGNELSTNMNQTATSINDITSTIGRIKRRVINQSTSVTETNATMEQVTLNIDKLNSHIENQSSHVSQTSAAVEQMVASIHAVTETLVRNSGNVQTLQEASEIGRASLQEVDEDIREIARESEGLLEINSVMQNIASQTNLLSMNAAIEAAHAGEAGRGFAVVADEIRKLAENSSLQSKTIGVVLKKIKDSIDKITRSTEKVLDKFQAIDSNVGIVAEQGTNIRGAMEEQEAGSRQVLNGIMQVNDTTRQVKTGSGEMLVGAKEVITESANLEKSTQEITIDISEMASGAEQINAAVDYVNQITIQNRQSIAALLQEVSRFKVEG
ncbi:MAG: methyl-accepting chemotaxis protein [Treponema sp.]|nr:methyl-accepting chemotaxis protein [Treponema sp.]